MLSLWDETEAPVALPSLDIHRLGRDLDRWWSTLGTVLWHVTNHPIEIEGERDVHGNVHCLGQIGHGVMGEMSHGTTGSARRHDTIGAAG
jgi:hypothetical protein